MTAFLDNIWDKLGHDLFILLLRRGFATECQSSYLDADFVDKSH